MTQPTIELVHELRNGICALWHRLAEMNGGVVNAGRIKDEEKLVGLLLNHCNQIRAALTAQAGDGNRLPERDVTKPSEQQGLFRKFEVRRVDGSDELGGKHHGCEYFVIDLTHDRYAYGAIHAYARACDATHPQLAVELMRKMNAINSEKYKALIAEIRAESAAKDGAK